MKFPEGSEPVVCFKRFSSCPLGLEKRLQGQDEVLKDRERSQYNDQEFSAQRDVSSVIDIHVDHFAEGSLVLAKNLPVASEPRVNRKALFLGREVTLQFCHCARTRPDNRHRASQDVKELRNLIDRKRSQKAPAKDQS